MSLPYHCQIPSCGQIITTVEQHAQHQALHFQQGMGVGFDNFSAMTPGSLMDAGDTGGKKQKKRLDSGGAKKPNLVSSAASDDGEEKAKKPRKKKAPEEPGLDEKRIKFLERNRAAATRCRERKKQWMQELQQRATGLTVSNNQMNSELSRLRDEVSQLKMMLIAQQGKEGAAAHGVVLTNEELAGHQ